MQSDLVSLTQKQLTDAHGHYPLRRLDWPFEQAPS